MNCRWLWGPIWDPRCVYLRLWRRCCCCFRFRCCFRCCCRGNKLHWLKLESKEWIQDSLSTVSSLLVFFCNFTSSVSTLARRRPAGAPGAAGVAGESGGGRPYLVLWWQALLAVVVRPAVAHVGLLHLATPYSSVGDHLQWIGALGAEGGRRGQVLWDAGARGEGRVGRVSFTVQQVNAVGRPVTIKHIFQPYVYIRAVSRINLYLIADWPEFNCD